MTEQPIQRKPSPEEIAAVRAQADKSGPRTLGEAEAAIQFQSQNSGT